MLNFEEISSKVPFKTVLSHYDVGFEETRPGELKFRTTNKKEDEDFFVVNVAKNLFLTPESGNVKGGVINFVSWKEGVGLYQAAEKINTVFLKVPEPKKEIPELELHEHALVNSDLRQHFEHGYCKKGIMAGNIAFKVHNPDKTVAGYVGWNPKTSKWFYPKGFKRPVYNIEKANSDYCILTVSPFDVLHIFGLGYPFILGLLGKTPTEGQLEQLKRFKRILLLHPEPQTISPVLSTIAFVKAPKLDKPVTELEDIRQYF